MVRLPLAGSGVFSEIHLMYTSLARLLTNTGELEMALSYLPYAETRSLTSQKM
jgi:hypothetical protein